jgi:hypothetical protein
MKLKNIFSVYMFGLHNDVSRTVKLKVSQQMGKWVCKSMEESGCCLFQGSVQALGWKT